MNILVVDKVQSWLFNRVLPQWKAVVSLKVKFVHIFFLTVYDSIWQHITIFLKAYNNLAWGRKQNVGLIIQMTAFLISKIHWLLCVLLPIALCKIRICWNRSNMKAKAEGKIIGLFLSQCYEWLQKTYSIMWTFSKTKSSTFVFHIMFYKCHLPFTIVIFNTNAFVCFKVAEL